MPGPKIVITETLDPTCAAWLEDNADVHWVSLDQPDELKKHLADAEGLIVRTYTQVNDELLDMAPKLQVVGRAGVGLDNVDLEACKARDIPVVYTPDANTQAVVEYVFALMFDEIRPRPTLDEVVTPNQFHEYRKTAVGVQLERYTLGVLGFGRIGKRVGQVAHAFGMNVHVTDIVKEVELRKKVDYPFNYVSHEKLYTGSDILTIHVDGRPENNKMINEEVLSKLRPHCIVINAARGSLVDANAMAAWANSVAESGGRAVLDVHDPEPPPSSYPLYGLPNVRLLPHLASRTETAMENMSWVVRDVVSVLNGESPNYPAW